MNSCFANWSRKQSEKQITKETYYADMALLKQLERMKQCVSRGGSYTYE